MLTKHSLNWFNSLRPSDAYMRRNLTNIGSDNGLSPGRCQTIIWSRDRSNIVNGTHRNKLQWKIRLTMSSAKYQPFCVSLNVLTNWRRDKMATILQTMLLNTFSWMKTLKFWLKFHWILFQTVQLIIFQHWFRWWLGAILATSHYLNQWWLVYRRIYASQGLSELILCRNITFIVNISKKQATIWRKTTQLFTSGYEFPEV